SGAGLLRYRAQQLADDRARRDDLRHDLLRQPKTAEKVAGPTLEAGIVKLARGRVGELAHGAARQKVRKQLAHHEQAFGRLQQPRLPLFGRQQLKERVKLEKLDPRLPED